MISLQSASAYIALFQLIPTDWPTPIWDACAGHGGKTLALLEQGLPIQCVSDPHQGRLNLFAHDFQRLKLAEAGRRLPQILPSRAEQTNFKQKFASVLLDAPCSGLGTLARRPEIRWRRTQDDLERLRLAQVQILDAAHAALIPHSGCRILYITCTLNPAENQNQMQNFLRSHPQYSLDIEYQTPPDSPLGEFFYSAALIRK